MKMKMSTLLFTCSLFLGTQVTHAGSATWNLSPASGDWNTAANWMPPTIPNGPADVATFSLSNQTSVSISDVTEVSSVVFDANASAFTITLFRPQS